MGDYYDTDIPEFTRTVTIERQEPRWQKIAYFIAQCLVWGAQFTMCYLPLHVILMAAGIDFWVILAVGCLYIWVQNKLVEIYLKRENRWTKIEATYVLKNRSS